VNESNEGNNVKSQSISCVGGQPDLVTNATVAHLSGARPLGIPFQVAVSTRNNGTASSGNYSVTRVEFGNATVAELAVPALDAANGVTPSNTQNVTLNCTQNGTFNITLRADFGNNVSESNENDNEWSYAVRCSSDYNLTISLNDSNSDVFDPLLFNYSLNSSVAMQPISFSWNLGLPECYDGILQNGSLYDGANMTGEPSPKVRYLCPTVPAYGMQYAELTMQVRLQSGAIDTIYSNRIPMNVSFCSRENCQYESYDDVLLVINNNSAASRAIGDYYMARRGVSHVVRLTNVTTYYVEVSCSYAEQNIRQPIYNYIRQNGLEGKINYIVLTKDIPVLTDYYSLDSFLSDPSSPMCTSPRASNPYYKYYYRSMPVFSSAKLGGKYLVTRLAGLTEAASMALVDRAYGNRDVGNFEFDKASSAMDAYRLDGNADIAMARLMEMGVDPSRFILDNTSSTYLFNQQNVLMYASFGSNDYRSRSPIEKWHYQYARPNNTWAPGAVAETYVSTSGRTFTDCPSQTPDGLKPNYYNLDTLASPRVLPAGTVLGKAFWQDGRIEWWLCGQLLTQDTYMLSGTRYWNFTRPAQSLIADWVEDGVAGAKGYVAEPYASAMAHVDTLFPRYYQGYNFADSFYSSSPYTHWMEIYPGDPKGRLNGASSEPVCKADGIVCSLPSECCSLQCSGGLCGAPVCLADGTSCSLPSQCCTGQCNGGLCGAPAGAPDLVANASASDLAGVHAIGTPFAVNVQTTNAGNALANASTTRATFGARIYDINVSSLAANASNTTQISLNCTSAGNFTLNITADFLGNVSESNESNSKNYTVECAEPGIYDLYPSAIIGETPRPIGLPSELTIRTISYGRNMVPPASITNVTFAGGIAASFTSGAYNCVYGNMCIYDRVINVTCPAYGYYNMTIEVDANSSIFEYNESNNLGNFTVPCGMLPDLVANVTPLGQLLLNQTDQTDFVVNVSTFNRGLAGASLSWTMVAFAGQNVTNISVSYQAPGRSYGQNATLRCPSVGNYTLSITADFNNTISEMNETNNQWNYTVRCEPATYTITVFANDTTPDVLEPVFLNYTISPPVPPQYINVTWNFGPWKCYDGALANGSLTNGSGMNTSHNATIRFLCPTLPEYGGPFQVYLTARIGLPSQPTIIVGSPQVPISVSLCSQPGCPYESYDDVLLVATSMSATSLAIRDYYTAQRGVSHVLTLTNVSPTYEEMVASYTDSDIRIPIYNYIQQNGLAGKINYIVLTKDFPIRIKCPTTYSLDASLIPLTSTVCSSHPASPAPAYYNSAYTYTPVYSSAKFGSPLVTRLSGWSRADALAQVDRAYGDKSTGNFVFDKCIISNGGACAQGGLQYINTNMDTAMARLAAMGVSPSRFIVDDGSSYLFNQPNVLMYVSWGINDVHSHDTLAEWNAHHASPGNSWLPGSVGEYYYSYSALTFNEPVANCL
jgi:uncharacterized protein (TIGR03790 family)